MNKKSLKNNSGFTLLEIMVAIGIIAIISGMIVQQESFSTRVQEVGVASQDLVDNFRKVQSYSLALKKFETEPEDVFPTGGWGLHFSDSRFYTIFADIDGDADYSANEFFEKVELPGAAVLEDIKVNGTSLFPNVLAVTFEPPDPIVWVSDSGVVSSGDEVEFIFKGSRGDLSTIFLNPFGLVERR